ncbi:Golgi transport complex subunit 6, variant 5 [Orbilia ellipsospora]|uniref:Conserved oligomeric Golgi complex subunit 6 n=3 Tax=Orbilia ellipsospora TaxID=2528407 RepID=A0AAV9WXJ5_9PEZI
MASSGTPFPLGDRDERYPLDDARAQENTLLKSSHLSAKTAHVLSTSATDSDIKEVLAAFDSSIETNNADNRRRVRSQILLELATSNSQVINDFELIATQVHSIGSALRSLHETFDDIVRRVDVGNGEVITTIQESEVILAERLKLDHKESLLQAFLEKFTIPATDLDNITSSPQFLDDSFFNTLVRVKMIHSDCQILLGSESTRAGVEIMDQMTRNLNSAYQRVYLWLQRELKFLSFETPTGNHRVRRALEVLTNRPALLQSCLDTLAESRQRTLNESFTDALTGRGEADMKPIDVMAHDPIRYTGDMMAWLHSALVGELEALQAIFELSGSERLDDMPSASGVITIAPTDLDLRDHVRPLADKSLENALSAFRLRTEHVISSHEEPTLLYGLLNILTFYRETFKKLVGADTLLVATTDSLASTTTRQLQSCLRDLFRSVQQDIPKPTPDLSPPLFLHDAMGRFRSLVKSFEASLISDSYKSRAFDMIYSEAMKPYIQGCETLSKDLPSPQCHIFMVNCLEVSKVTNDFAPITISKSPLTCKFRILYVCQAMVLKIICILLKTPLIATFCQ